MGIFLLLALTGCKVVDGVPALGFDDKGQAQQVIVPASEYQGRFQALVTHFTDSALPVLEAQEQNNQFSVRTFVLGIGVNAEIGVGSLKVGAFPKVRLIYSNSQKPSYP